MADAEAQRELRLEKTRQSTEERLTRDFEYRRQLETKDLEAELKLRDQEINGLKNKIDE